MSWKTESHFKIESNKLVYQIYWNLSVWGSLEHENMKHSFPLFAVTLLALCSLHTQRILQFANV